MQNVNTKGKGQEDQVMRAASRGWTHSS